MAPSSSRLISLLGLAVLSSPAARADCAAGAYATDQGDAEEVALLQRYRAVQVAGDAEKPDEAQDEDDAEDPDEAQVADDAEEPDEAQDAQDAEDPDEAQDGDDAEEPDEAQDKDDADEPDEAQDGDDEAQDEDDAEDPDEAQDEDDAEEPDEAQDGDDAEDPDEAQDADDAEEPDEAQDAADAVDPDEAQDGDDTEEHDEAQDGELSSVLAAGQPSASLSATMGPYFLYSGNFHVQGRVRVTSTGLLSTGAQALAWQLSGLDSRCKDVGSAPNSCGIHIHAGTTCYEAAGSHYYAGRADPWMSVVYSSEADGTSKGEGSTTVVTELSGYDVMGRTVVAHDYEGRRIGCGLLVPKTLFVPDFVPYFNYEGDLAIRGTMTATDSGVLDDAQQTLAWRFSGVDGSCRRWPRNGHCNSCGRKRNSDSCGVSLRTGFSCLADAGPHLFLQHSAKTRDPWERVRYSVKGRGNYSQEEGLKVMSGLRNTNVLGRTLVVHDFEGHRVGCGILSPRTLVANAYVPYFSYKGYLRVDGWVSAEAVGAGAAAGQAVSWELTGLDPDCATPPAPGANMNACGIHIHVGMSCSGDAGAHYFDGALSPDPWAAVKYLASKDGTASASKVAVVTRLTNFDVLGHAVLVHDAAGGRIACGILSVGSRH